MNNPILTIYGIICGIVISICLVKLYRVQKISNPAEKLDTVKKLVFIIVVVAISFRLVKIFFY